jgi:hypothetical protein
MRQVSDPKGTIVAYFANALQKIPNGKQSSAPLRPPAFGFSESTRLLAQEIEPMPMAPTPNGAFAFHRFAKNRSHCRVGKFTLAMHGVCRISHWQ